MSAAPAQSYPHDQGPRPELTDPGNTSSSLAGSAPAPLVGEDASDIQHTLPQDFTLSNLKAETKGEEFIVPDTAEEGGVLQEGDIKPDHKRPGIASHDVDIPGANPDAPPQPSNESKRVAGAQY